MFLFLLALTDNDFQKRRSSVSKVSGKTISVVWGLGVLPTPHLGSESCSQAAAYGALIGFFKAKARFNHIIPSSSWKQWTNLGFSPWPNDHVTKKFKKSLRISTHEHAPIIWIDVTSKIASLQKNIYDLMCASYIKCAQWRSRSATLAKCPKASPTSACDALI